jgi:uncharacterized membrane protein
MERPLSRQKSIDSLAIAFALVLALLIAFASSLVISIVSAMIYSRSTAEGMDDSVGGGMLLMGIFFLSMMFLSPLWLWFGFRLRRAIKWPRGAFERTTRIAE